MSIVWLFIKQPTIRIGFVNLYFFLFHENVNESTLSSETLLGRFKLVKNIFVFFLKKYEALTFMYNVKEEEISKGTFIVIRRHKPRDCLQTIKCLWLVKFLLSSHFSLLGHLPSFHQQNVCFNSVSSVAEF